MSWAYIWSFDTNGPKPTCLECISHNTTILPSHSMLLLHIAMWWLCSIVSFVVGSASEDTFDYPTEGQYPTTTPSGKQSHWSYRYNPMFSLLLSFTAFATTTFQTIVCCGSWTISSAWPVIPIVTRWNPLARVGVVWAISVFPTLLCLLCLELCQVWFIWVMG